VRQVDRDVLPLRVALQHAFEGKLAADAAFLIATVGVTGALAETLVDLNPTSLDGVCRAQCPADVVRPDLVAIPWSDEADAIRIANDSHYGLAADAWYARRYLALCYEFLRQRKPDNAIVVKSNWRDNPWFTAELEEERQLDLKLYPERYDHIWEGEFARAFEGAYFAKQLAQAKAEGRIGHVGADPLLPYRVFFDLGGTGARADALAICIVQFVGREIRVLDYIEGVGQEVGYYLSELRKRKYEQALLVLPHDGNAHHGPIHKTYKDHFQDADFEVDVIPNQGAGAATLRIEAARRILPRCWFNEKTTQAGIEALGFYHERKDEACFWIDGCRI